MNDKKQTADEILKKYEDDNEYHFHSVDRKWIIEAMEQYAAFRQPPVISCVCPNEIKTGTVSIHCCNLCGKPDEDWWGKHCL